MAGESEVNIPPDQVGWLNKIVGPLTNIVKDRTDEVAVEMRKGFYKHCLRVDERCGYVKTIMSRGEKN